MKKRLFRTLAVLVFLALFYQQIILVNFLTLLKNIKDYVLTSQEAEPAPGKKHSLSRSHLKTGRLRNPE